MKLHDTAQQHGYKALGQQRGVQKRSAGRRRLSSRETPLAPYTKEQPLVALVAATLSNCGDTLKPAVPRGVRKSVLARSRAGVR